MVGELFILNEALHQGNAPTFVGVVLFKDPDEVVIPEEPGFGSFIVHLDVLERQRDV